MAELVLSAPNGEIERVFAKTAKAVSGPPADVEILHVERRVIVTHERWRGSVGALSDTAHLAIELRRIRKRVVATDPRRDRALEPVVAEIARRFIRLWIRIERVRKAKRAPARREVELPVESRRKPRRRWWRGRLFGERHTAEEGKQDASGKRPRFDAAARVRMRML